MKLRIISDLHLEASNVSRLENMGEDVLILAGDISAIPELLVEFFERKVDPQTPVLYVLGNHEYEYQHIKKAASYYKDLLAEFPNVKILDNESITLKGVEFIGSTLWSNFEGEGVLAKNQLKDWVSAISDFRKIKSDHDYITPCEMEAISTSCIDYLTRALNNSKASKCVVISHFAPHLMSRSDRFSKEKIGSGYWVNNLPQLLGKSCVHVHGHVHDSKDYTVGKTRVICNPRGRSLTMGLSENPGFSMNFCVEI